MSEASPESLLKSALEKIVYFEARSTQLANDLQAARADADRLRGELAHAGQREIELRRLVAEQEVRLARAHVERQDSARVSEALRRERGELIGKMLDASRIHGAGQEVDGFDLAQFIATLRAEVLSLPPSSDEAKPARDVAEVARALDAEGRLQVSAADLARLERAAPFPGRSEETLFGFSVRELSAPDAAARTRAAERLKALGHVAAAPALATALHAETEAGPLVALLGALAAVAKAEAAPVVTPHLSASAPDVRIAALKALSALDPAQAVPHMAAAMKDPDRAVRRRASMLALQLRGGAALELGAQAIHDELGDVRALAALVLGASGNDAARPLLVSAMRDPEERVRSAASQALSRLLGRDVTALVGLEERARAREVRRLSQVEARPVRPTMEAIAARLQSLTNVRPEHVEGPSTPLGLNGVGTVLPGVALSGAGTRAAPPSVGGAAAAALAARESSAALSSAGGALAARELAAAPSLAGGGELSAAPSSAGGAPAGRESCAAPPFPGGGAGRESSSSPSSAGGALAARESSAAASTAAPRAGAALAAPTSRVAVVDAPAPSSAPEVLAGLLGELRAAMRGRTLDELARDLGVSAEAALSACGALIQRGQVVRRGLKYFVA